MRFALEIKPPITVLSQDIERLENLATAAAKSNPVVAEFLANEIARAELQASPLPGLVSMGSLVVYRDDLTGEVRKGRLVYPEAADISAGRISVLSPLGAALIGLSVGQSIDFPTHSGASRSITVLGSGK